MEAFIERTNALLAARPETTRISTRYTHKHTSATGERVESSAKPATVVVKAFDPVSGTLYKYKVKKANELSRILASLGPQLFEFGESKKWGAASIMSDVEPKDSGAPEPEKPEAKAEKTEKTEAKAEPKKKKKTKKR